MQILEYQNKGNHLNTIERFYIYTDFTKNNHLNDENNISPNRIFDALTKTPIAQTKNPQVRDHSPLWLPQNRTPLQTSESFYDTTT